MASILKVDDLRGNTAAGNITITSEGGAATMQLQQGLIKSFVEGGNHSAGAIQGDTFNVAGYVDYATGIAEFTLTNAMNNADYPVISSSQSKYLYQGYAASTTAYRASTVNSSGAFTDGNNAAVIAGDLA